MKILNLYHSSTNNTKKVANRIEKTLLEKDHYVDTIRVTSNIEDIDILKYDFVFAGSGVYNWLPGKPIQDLFSKLLTKYSDSGEIKPGCPKRPGKKAIIYCTYGGVHTGRNEAIPAVKYMGQMFDHLGYTILGEWYIVGDYPDNMGYASKEGRLGNIEGRPNEQDLKDVEEKVKGVMDL